MFTYGDELICSGRTKGFAYKYGFLYPGRTWVFTIKYNRVLVELGGLPSMIIIFVTAELVGLPTIGLILQKGVGLVVAPNDQLLGYLYYPNAHC